MTDLIHHYKDREPEETIQIIIDFFKSKNIDIKCRAQYHSEINTYSCVYDLYWQGKEILSANGKGMTEIYSKASCLAELYERFCAYIWSYSNNFFLKQDVMNRRKEKYGYYFYPNEKKLTKEEYLNNTYTHQAFSEILPNLNDNTFYSFMHFFSNDKIIGMPYQSFTDDKIVYQDFHAIFRKIGTTGLATGNTIEEALVQSSSEIFERYITEKFFNNIQNEYYLITYENEQTQKLREAGYEIFLYDLSYNFNLPVILLVLKNIQNQTVYLKFGSSPIFDIAVERCFTEVYQGFIKIAGNTINNIELNIYNPKLTKDYIYQSQKGLLVVDYTKLIFPDFLLFNSKPVNTFNKKIFLESNDYSNIQLLDHIKQLLQLNNLHFNWLNISLSNKIFAVHVVPEEYILTCRSGLLPSFSDLKINYKQALQNMQNYCFNLLIKIKNNKVEYNQANIENVLHQIIKDFQSIDTDIYNPLFYLSLLFGNNIYKIYQCKDDIDIEYNYNSLIDILLQTLNSPPLEVFFPIRDSRKLLWEHYEMFKTLKSRNCDKQYIKKVFDTLNIEFIDFDKYNDSIYIYLIYLLYVDNFYKIYNSLQYKEYLNIFDYEIL